MLLGAPFWNILFVFAHCSVRVAKISYGQTPKLLASLLHVIYIDCCCNF